MIVPSNTGFAIYIYLNDIPLISKSGRGSKENTNRAQRLILRFILNTNLKMQFNIAGVL